MSFSSSNKTGWGSAASVGWSFDPLGRKVLVWWKRWRTYERRKNERQTLAELLCMEEKEQLIIINNTINISHLATA